MSNIFIPRHELENLILSAFLNSDVSETNAASVAGLLLTTDCAIFDLPKDPNNPQPSMPNMM